MVEGGCRVLWVVVGGCGWLWVVVGGCGWLWVVVDACVWLWAVVDGCGWLVVVLVGAGEYGEDVVGGEGCGWVDAETDGFVDSAVAHAATTGAARVYCLIFETDS